MLVGVLMHSFRRVANFLMKFARTYVEQSVVLILGPFSVAGNVQDTEDVSNFLYFIGMQAFLDL